MPSIIQGCEGLCVNTGAVYVPLNVVFCHFSTFGWNHTTCSTLVVAAVFVVVVVLFIYCLVH